MIWGEATHHRISALLVKRLRVVLPVDGRSGTNNSAMFAEIVPEQLRSAVYAFDRSFEGAVGATAAPLVGQSAHAIGSVGEYEGM